MSAITRFYFGADGERPFFTPTTTRGGWHQPKTASANVLLPGYKGGHGTGASSATETSVTNPRTCEVLRFVMDDVLEAQVVSAGTMSGVLYGVGPTGADVAYLKIYAFVTQGRTDAVRCVLVDFTETTTAIPNPAAGVAFTATMLGGTIQAGDVLVVEIGASFANSTTSSRSVTLTLASISSGVGSHGAPLADQVAASTTLGASYLDFSPALTVNRPAAVVGDLLASNRKLYLFDKDTGALKSITSIPGNADIAGGVTTADGSTTYLAQEGDDRVLVYDSSLTLIATHVVSSGGSQPHAVALDGAGRIYVGFAGDDGDACTGEGGAPSGTSWYPKRFLSDGTPDATFAVARENGGSNALDLSADGTIAYYTSVGRCVKAYDVALDAQLPDLVDLGADASMLTRGIRVLQDGTLLLADKANVKRIRLSDGAVIQTYTFAGQDDWGTLAIDPSGGAFWVANRAEGPTPVPAIYKVDLASGSALLMLGEPEVVDTGGFLCSGGITVVGEPRAALSASVPPSSSVPQDYSTPCCSGGEPTGTSAGAPVEDPDETEQPPPVERECEGGGTVDLGDPVTNGDDVFEDD